MKILKKGNVMKKAPKKPAKDMGKFMTKKEDAKQDKAMMKKNDKSMMKKMDAKKKGGK